MRAVISLLVAVAFAALAAVALGSAQGGLGPISAWVAIAAGAICAVLAARDLPPGTLSRAATPRGWVEWTVVLAFALFALRAFCWLVYFDGPNLSFLLPNNLGDLPLHIAFTRYFANGVPFWPENPIFAGEGLRYPLGVDLANSLALLAGVDLIRGYVWAGLLGSLATGVMLWRWGGAFALAGFLFNGGFAAWQIFRDGNLDDFQTQIAWKSIPLALFVTQRGLLYAVPAGLALLWSWRARLLRGGPGLPLWVEALLYGTMPLFHLHTFLFLSFMLAGWFALSFCGLGLPASLRGGILKLVACSALPATVLVWVLTGGFHGGSLIHLKPGWMQGERNPFLFWLENFGILPLCIVAVFMWLTIILKKTEPGSSRHREAAVQLAIVIPAVLLFLVGCFVMFAPWEWDNTKLFLWSYLAVLPPLWAMLRRRALWLRSVACFLFFFSGFVALIGGLDGGGHTLVQRSILDSLANPLKTIPATSTFACLPTYNHPLLLMGRKVVAGYEGHLFSHGIDYRDQMARLERLLRAEPGWQQEAQRLRADYLFWGAMEEERYGQATAGWAAEAPIVAQGAWGRIYDLRAWRQQR